MHAKRSSNIQLGAREICNEDQSAQMAIAGTINLIELLQPVITGENQQVHARNGAVGKGMHVLQPLHQGLGLLVELLMS